MPFHVSRIFHFVDAINVILRCFEVRQLPTHTYSRTHGTNVSLWRIYFCVLCTAATLVLGNWTNSNTKFIALKICCRCFSVAFYFFFFFWKFITSKCLWLSVGGTSKMAYRIDAIQDIAMRIPLSVHLFTYTTRQWSKNTPKWNVFSANDLVFIEINCW